jgi:integrase
MPDKNSTCGTPNHRTSSSPSGIAGAARPERAKPDADPPLPRRWRVPPLLWGHRIGHGTATLVANNGLTLEELSRYMGHASTQVARRYAIQTPVALGIRAAAALTREGVASGSTPGGAPELR